jgi:serine/threonine protein kinase
MINFQREVSLMSQLRHPHIMQLVACAGEPLMVIVTKYMSGGNLYQLIHSGTVSDDAVFVRIVADIASAMAYLHACEPPVVHRDLTSPNVLIDANYRAYVSDFGLAKIKHPHLLPSGQRGNLSWLAPEALYQTAFEKPCDVYSFGVILWEVTSRLVPYAGLNRREIEAAKRAGSSPGPIPDACPPVFRQLIELCVHVNPASRPEFAVISEGLEQLIDLLAAGHSVE